MKIAVFCLPGLDSFAKQLFEKFTDHEVVFNEGRSIKQAVKDIHNSDVVWIEWGNDIAIHMTTKQKILEALQKKRVILRIHSYEVLLGSAYKINFAPITDIVFVSKHIREYFGESIDLEHISPKTHIIPNPVDTEKYSFQPERVSSGGTRVGFMGYLSDKKGIMLMMHAFHSLPSNASLHVAGKWQDPRYMAYFSHMIREMGLESRVHFDGWQKDPDKWLENIDSLLCTSPWESQNLSVMQAMSRGMMVYVHNFVGCKNVYPPEVRWTTLEDLKALWHSPYPPEKLRQHVTTTYSFEAVLPQIEELFTFVEGQEEHQKLMREKINKVDDTVACVIAVRNGSETILKPLRSLMRQTKKVGQIIIVNDASVDNTEAVVDNFIKENDPERRIQGITLPENKWVPGARNIGAKRVTTDFIFFLDADDYIADDYVEKTTACLNADEKVFAAYTDMAHFSEDKEPTYIEVPEYDPERLVNNNYMHYAAMMRLRDFVAIKGYSEYLGECRNHCYDQELWCRFTKHSYAKRVPDTHFYYSVGNDESTSKNYERPRSDMDLQMIQTAFPEGKLEKLKVKDGRKKILLVCWGRDYMDREKFSWEAYTFIKPLEKFGEVFTFFWDIEEKYYGSGAMMKRLVANAELIDPDLIFHIGYKENINKRTWKILSAKFNTCVWFADDNWRFDDYSKDYGEGFRNIITTYEEAYEGHKELADGERNVFLSQWGVNEFYFKPRRYDREIDVIFIGQTYGDRVGHINALIDAGINVEWYGHGSPNGMIDYMEMCHLLADSKIALNFTKGADGKNQIKARPFEVCATRACLLTEYVKGIEEYYHSDDIITFRSIEDMVEKVKSLLADEVYRKETATSGYNNTLSLHTWEKRFEPIFKEIWENK